MALTFDAFGLAVADMAAALAFYRELGLDIPKESDDAPHVDVPVPGGTRLMFDSHAEMRSFDPSFAGTGGGSQFALAFSCADPSEVDAVYARLTGQGHRGYKEPWDAFWGQRYATVLDPDGNHVDLYAALPAKAAG